MSTGLAEVTARAYDLFEAGDLSAAQLLLADALSAADTDPERATTALADAASLHSRVLVGLGEPHSARAWAAFAHEAESRLYGPTHERTIRAAATLASVLHRIGNHADAAALYGSVIEGLTALEGPESPQVLAAHADLATVEYARGECDIARARLAEAWDMTREAYGDAHPAGIRMLARLGAMERDCGQFTEAHQHLAHARELCRAYLDPDHPLVTQIASLSRAPANPHHNCGGPALPTAPVSGDDDAYPGLRDVDGSPLDLPPARGEAPPNRPQSPVPPDIAETWPPGDRAAKLPVHVPREHRRRRGRGGPAPLVTGALVAAVIGAVAVVVGLAAVEQGQGGDETAPPAASWPPPPATSAPQASAPATSAAPPSPTAAAPARPGTPPSRVTIDDGGQSIELRWAYPVGAQGKVRVSGAPKGQQQRPFEDLPAGSTSYVVHGLEQDRDFCFEIAVVYSAETIGRAKPVCTTRQG
ncbi:tetratricopeptide repeat protein [Phytohabitans kaempferiae]|uniref:Tetratricopeptide repeat protein n=1 Tax=Phytohabitans kaempferiae TaxID=1620943 RepID=A0ABV6LXX2_9ACTN